jgi:signal transduction histidine kinase
MSRAGTDPKASAGRHADVLKAGQVDLLYEQAHYALFATLVIGLLLAAALWGFVPHMALGSWLLATVVLTFGRYWGFGRYRAAKSKVADWALWRNRFLAGAALNGVLWGLAGTFFFVPDSPGPQTLLAFTLAGMSAGAVTTLSPVRGASLLFLLPVLVPYSIRLLANGGETHLIMAGMVELFVILMWSISRRLHANVEKSLRLRFENVELVSDLTQARDTQDVAHRALTAQIEETQRAQLALHESYADLEVRVQGRTQELEELTAKLEATIVELDLESKAAEAARSSAESASAAKSQFLAVVSHELRTPLNVILGYQDLLAAEVAGELNEVQLKYLNRATVAAQQLLGLIDQILNLARIEAGREELEIEDAELSALTNEVAELVEPLAAKKQLDFSVRLPDRRYPIRTDTLKVRQVLLNLLSNAIKFTEEGKVAMTAGAADGQITFVVSDTGPGIAAADLERIFDAFTQAVSTSTRASGSTGLGLSVSRSLAELLGGSLTVESAIGKGSSFTLQLPANAGISKPLIAEMT